MAVAGLSASTGGNTSARLSGSLMVSPWLMLSRVAMMASVSTLLPAVLATMSSESYSTSSSPFRPTRTRLTDWELKLDRASDWLNPILVPSSRRRCKPTRSPS